jgi:Uma2 family endonuclease
MDGRARSRYARRMRQVVEEDIAEGVTQDPEQRILLSGVSWSKYEALLKLLGEDFPGIRVAYLEGELEIVSTSRKHELVKKMTARLVEIYAVELDVALNGFGSATFRKRAKQRGIEPDECWIIDEDKEFPDIAFEVILSPPRIDHLAIYEGLRVREVWFWRRGEFSIHRLTPKGYERRARSELLPDLDFGRLATYVERSDQTRAVREFRDSLRPA